MSLMLRLVRAGCAALRRRTAPVVLLTSLIAASGTACAGTESSPHDAIRDFLVGWQSGEYKLAAQRTDGDQQQVAQDLESVVRRLDAVRLRLEIERVTVDGDTANAGFGVEIDLGENGPPWRYDGRMELRRADGRWRVHWAPSVIHPDLGSGQRLAVTTDRPTRGPLLDRDGRSLREKRRVYTVGVIPAEVKNEADLAVSIAKRTALQKDRLRGRINSAPPKEFVELATFPANRLDRYRALGKLAGVEIRPRTIPLSAGSAKGIVGIIDSPQLGSGGLGGAEQVAAPVGISGLEKVYEDRLAGAPSTKVVALDADDEVNGTLEEWPGRDGQQVKTTLDKSVQAAAEQAVSGGGMLVALRPSSGEILAVADNVKGKNANPLTGEYAPGAAFSIVSAAAALGSGFSPGTKVPCPEKRTVAGVTFSGHGVLHAQPYSESFATGCTAATAALARLVPEKAMSNALTAFGLGADLNLPVPASTGKVPEWAGLGAQAKLLAGQTPKVSPLGMALVAGAVESGTWRAPSLVLEPLGHSPRPPQADERPLDPDVARQLRKMMKAPDGVPVRGVYGISAGDWFVGWQNDVAVAILDKSPKAAGNVATQFFSALR